MKWGIGILLVSLVCGCVTTHPIAWKTLPEFDVSYEKAWNVLLDVLTEDWELEVVEKESGYIKSSWTVKTDVMGDVTEKYMFDCKVVSRAPVKIKLRVRGSKQDPWAGLVKTGFPEKEKELLEEIEGRLRTLSK